MDQHLDAVRRGSLPLTKPHPFANDCIPSEICEIPHLADLPIRLAGLVAVALAAAIILWLRRTMPAEADLARSLAAATAFLSASLGSGLLALGRHLHDPVILSDRWRPRG
jgi:hypothetical protein